LQSQGDSRGELISFDTSLQTQQFMQPSTIYQSTDRLMFEDDNSDERDSTSRQLTSFLNKEKASVIDGEEEYVEMSGVSRREDVVNEHSSNIENNRKDYFEDFDKIDDVTSTRVHQKSQEETPHIHFDDPDRESSNKTNRKSRLAASKSLRRVSSMVARVSTRVVNISNLTREQLQKVDEYVSEDIKLPKRQSRFRKSTDQVSIIDDDKASLRQPIVEESPVGQNSTSGALGGNALFIFGPDHPVRKALYVILSNPFEIAGRIVVSGFIINPKNEETIDVTQSLSVSTESHHYAPNTVRGHSAYLRHTFNRLDLVAVVCYWIDLMLTFSGVHNFYIFKALSTLRSLRLLAISSALLVYKLSKDRYGGEGQYCGGHYQNGISHPFIGSPVSYAKGYVCPEGQVCMEVGNPYNGLYSFDNVGYSMILMFLVASTSNWTDLMYKIMDAEFGWSSIFFITGIVVLNFWLLNLFIAVIISMFAKIREDNASRSAFTLSKSTPVLLEEEEGWTLQNGHQKSSNWLSRFMERTNVVGSVAGLANLILFILMVNLIAAISGLLLLKGYIPNDGTNLMTFADFYNSFIAFYQLFSGSDWTTVFNNVLQYDSMFASTASAIIAALFLMTYIGVSNFILLNMFVAVIAENFEIAEEEKHKRQVQAFRQKSDPSIKKEEAIYRWNFYRYFKAKPKAIAVESIPSNLILQTQKSRVWDLLKDDQNIGKKSHPEKNFMEPTNKFVIRIKRFFGHEAEDDEIALIEREVSGLQYEETKGTTENMNPIATTVVDKHAETYIDDYQERQALKADFIAAHPGYDTSLWLFPSRNRLRRFCQLLVPPSHGRRIKGIPPSPTWSTLFSAFIYVCIVANVVLATIVVPSYQKQYFQDRGGLKRITWFWITDVVFAAIFTVECLIKIVADGFLLTPNAYLLNVWNILDFFVLATLYANVVIGPTSRFGAPRIIRSFKALRALRLINLNSAIKDTFYSILIAGAPRILDASFLALSLIIPFAIYGTNIFAGLFLNCNDNGSSIQTINDCVEEYGQTTFNWAYLSPRVWNNPYQYSFDSFKDSLLILFEGVSGEGWINVMNSAMQITGLNLSPQPNATKWNAMFFVIFNLAGSVFVLTVFVSVIITNFQKKSGEAYLTEEQKRWNDLKKLLKRIKPSKLPKKLEGSFQVRIHDSEHLVPNLVRNSRVVHSLTTPDERDSISSMKDKNRFDLLAKENIDTRKLQQNLKNLNPSKISQRKRIYNMIYQEAMLSTERDALGNEKGISFTNMLLLLAHYKLVDDEKCLQINEYIKRAKKLEKVKDNVCRDRVKSLLRTIYWRKKFKAIKESRRSVSESVPLIRVDNQESQVPTLQINTPGFGHISFQSNSPTTPTFAAIAQSPNSPNSQVFEHDGSLAVTLESNLESPSRISRDSSSGDFSGAGTNNTWNSVDASRDMDSATADQVLNSLQSNSWHGKIQVIYYYSRLSSE
ncbi:10486_t:CDS:10, partial [Acaulospora colombiana]